MASGYGNRGVGARAPGRYGRGVARRTVLPRVGALPLPGRRTRAAKDGEGVVAAILDALASDGWSIVHDARPGRGGVDHIAIGPAGVFAIETKRRRGRLWASRLKRRWLARASAEGRRLEELAGVRVDCVLVFSDVYIVDRALAPQPGVAVLPARMLAGHLLAGEAVLSREQVRERYARILSGLSAL